MSGWEQTLPSGDGARRLVVAAGQDSTGNDFGNHLLPPAAIDIEKFVREFVLDDPIEGRMTGGGSVFTATGVRITHGFELHSNLQISPNNLEINFEANNFHLEQLTSAVALETELDQSPVAGSVDRTIRDGYDLFNAMKSVGEQ